MKIFNLYSGLGGNRRLWGDEHSITSIELNEEIAMAYKDIFPNDEVIVADAHQYLLNNYENYDFIWSSPPCQSHSRIRQYFMVRSNRKAAIFPDMKLYQEIIFLQANAKCKWVVENVIPYYKPLIKPSIQLGRHLFWCNYSIPKVDFITNINIKKSILKDYQKYNLSSGNIKNKKQVYRNCVEPEIGEYILSIAENVKKEFKCFNETLF
jgi:DNA (cytosine-5)-methyltransferase 1